MQKNNRPLNLNLNLNIPINLRMGGVKNIVSLAIIITLLCTWQLWTPGRYYPEFPGSETLFSVNSILAYAIPVLLLISLLMIVLFRRPRFFIVSSVILSITLVLLDTGRNQYWFYFYILVLLVLAGYNWRVDNAYTSSSFLNAFKMILAGVYVITVYQHVGHSFINTDWPLFIKPFEKIATPEQCRYLLKAGHIIPFLEVFMVIGLFFNRTKLAAIGFAILFHIFSFMVLLMQNAPAEPAVLIWHIAMPVFVCIVFPGNPAEQKNHVFALNFYALSVILVFGGIIPAYIIMNDQSVKNKIDLMQNNHAEQYLYFSDKDKSSLPLYIQSFASARENSFNKLAVTRWALHETGTKQMLSTRHLLQISQTLNTCFGVQSGITATPPQQKTIVALK
jgi:hypothetical protein